MCVARAQPDVDIAGPEAATQVATMVETTFVPAVMGVARGDVTELKLFIAAAQAGWRCGFGVEKLHDLMGGLPVQSAGRPLAKEEEDLRALWLALVYLALEMQGDTGSGDPALVPASMRDELSSYVTNLLRAKAAAEPPSELDVAEMAGDGAPRSSMELAVLKQSMRVVYVTVDVLESIADAGERADAPTGKADTSTPGPFIPQRPE